MKSSLIDPLEVYRPVSRGNVVESNRLFDTAMYRQSTTAECRMIVIVCQYHSRPRKYWRYDLIGPEFDGPNAACE